MESGVVWPKCGTSSGPDTLEFSSVKRAPVSGDLGGYLVRVVVADGRWLGFGSQAYGDQSPLLPLSSVVHDSLTGVIEFDVVAYGNPSHFRVRISCDSIWGSVSPFPGATEVPVSLPRRTEGR